MSLFFSYSRNINSDIDVTVHCCPETNLDSPKNFLPDCVLSSNLSQPELKLKYCNDCKNQNPKPICTQDLLSWAFQVARGMEYVSQKKASFDIDKSIKLQKKL